MSTPDPKTVREIAREAVRRGGSDSGYGFIGSVISDHAAMDEMLASGDRAAFGRLHAAVRAELKGAAITVEWPDELRPADVVGAEQDMCTCNEPRNVCELRTELDRAHGQLKAALVERSALAERVAELKSEREADTRAVLAVLKLGEVLYLGQRPTDWADARRQLNARFADRIAALADDTGGGAE